MRVQGARTVGAGWLEGGPALAGFQNGQAMTSSVASSVISLLACIHLVFLDLHSPQRPLVNPKVTAISARVQSCHARATLLGPQGLACTHRQDVSSCAHDLPRRTLLNPAQTQSMPKWSGDMV